mgnify:CR=1 FL=1|tara:strand:+ start:1121 stop:1684 length:564 start_codon:yes stop_codon:yes gene_type:complete
MKIFRLLFMLNIAVVITVSIFSFLIYKDAIEFKENFGASSNLILLEQDNKALTGFVMREPPEILSEKKLEQYSIYLATDNYPKVLGTYYKLILVNMETISGINQDSFTIQGEELTKDETLDILGSKDSLDYKAAVFSYIFSKHFNSPGNLLGEYKKGNIFIYPEPIVFKLIKIMPVSLLESALRKVK